MIIASDSYSALICLGLMSSYTFYDNRMEANGIPTHFLWGPAHVGVEANAHMDILAKQMLRYKPVDLQLPESKPAATV